MNRSLLLALLVGLIGCCHQVLCVSQIRFGHGVAGGPNLDIYTGTTLIQRDVAFGDMTAYTLIDPGFYNLTAMEAGTQIPFVEGTVAAEDMQVYTVLAAGASPANPATPLSFWQMPDTAIIPQAGHARVRFLHAAAGVASVTLKGDGANIWSEVRYHTSGNPTYREFVGDAEHAFTLVDAATGAELLPRRALTFHVGSVYTIYLTGKADSLEMNVAEDASFLYDSNDRVCHLRVFHAAAGVGDVDVDINSTPFAHDLAYKGVTDYQEITANHGSGEVTVSVGGKVTSEVAIQWQDGEYATVIIVGSYHTPGTIRTVNLIPEIAVPPAAGHAAYIFMNSAIDEQVIVKNGEDQLFIRAGWGAEQVTELDVAELSISVTKRDDTPLAGPTAVALTEGQATISYLVGDPETPYEIVSMPTHVITATGTGMVRIIHSLLYADVVDVWVDNQPTIMGVAYGSATEYKKVHSGVISIDLKEAGTSKSVLAQSIHIVKGVFVSLCATGNTKDPSAQQPAFEQHVDDLSQPPAGKATLRLVHNLVSFGAADLWANGEKIISNVVQHSASVYVPVEATILALTAKSAGGDPIITTLTLTPPAGPNSPGVVESGALITVVLQGEAAPGDYSRRMVAFQDFKYEDVSPHGKATIVLHNALVGETSLDFYEEDNPIATALGYGEFTSPITVNSAKEVKFSVRAPGTTTDITESLLELRNDGQYTVIAYGTAAEPVITIQEHAETDPLQNSLIRLTHIAAGIAPVQFKFHGQTSGPVLYGSSATPEYIGIAEGVTTFTVVDNQNPAQQIATSSVGLVAGQTSTLFLEMAADGKTPMLITLLERSFATEKARWRLVNAGIGYDKVDVYIGDDKVQDGVSYGSFTGYTAVDAGAVVFSVRAHPGGAVLFTSTLNFDGNERYTVAFMGDNDDQSGYPYKLLSLIDDVSLPPPEHTKIRFLNVAEGVSYSLKVGSSVYTDVGYGQLGSPPYEQLAIDSPKLSCTLTTQQGNDVDTRTAENLPTASVYTIVAIGKPATNTPPQLIFSQDVTNGLSFPPMSDNFPAWAIVLIVFGVLFGILLIAGVAGGGYWYYKTRYNMNMDDYSAIQTNYGT